MKKIFTPVFFGIAALIIYSSCSSTKTVTMNTIRPAEITLPADIQTILLVDRTRTKNNFLTTAESILTGEFPDEDRAAVQEGMNSLKNLLQTSPRYKVKIATERLYGNSLTSVFPNPLSWDEVNELCKNYGTEALLTVEVFDTDFIITDGKRIVKKTVGEGTNKREIEVDEFYAEGVGNLKMGIRFYYPATKNIIDQQLISRTNTWKAAAASKREALATLLNKSRASSWLAQRIGSSYAYKISPMPVRISRPFYKKSRKSTELEIGTRMADVNDWVNAANTWERGLRLAGVKDGGYLTYNLAIAYEVLGDFETARKWAQQSYVKYGNKKARSYVSALDHRIWQEGRVAEQMK